MVKAVFDFDIGGSVTGFRVTGHAGSGPYGHDLVCAAVSGIVLGGLNALEDPEEAYRIEILEGSIDLRACRAISSHDRTVLSVIERQLESLEASYPDNLRLERKEKP